MFCFLLKKEMTQFNWNIPKRNTTQLNWNGGIIKIWQTIDSNFLDHQN